MRTAVRGTSGVWFAALIVTALAVGGAVGSLGAVGASAAGAGIVAILLTLRPSLALALLFCGQALFFVALTLMDLAPNSILTGSYYVGLLVAAVIGFLSRSGSRQLIGTDLIVCALVVWTATNWLMLSLGTDWATEKMSYLPVLAIAPYIAARLTPTDELRTVFSDILRVAKCASVVLAISLALSSDPIVRLSPFGEGSDALVNPILVGLTAGIGFILLYAGIVSRTIRISAGALGWFGLFGFVMARAASRGAIVSTLAAIIVIHLAVGVSRRSLALLTTLGAGTAYIASLLPHYVSAFYQGTFLLTPASSTYLRAISWSVAWKQFLAAPLTGVGVGRYPEGVGGSSALLLYPHNLLLESAAELGLVGLILVLSLIVPLFWRLFSEVRRSRRDGWISAEFLIMLALLGFTVVEAMFSGFLQAQTYLFVALGLAAGRSVARSREGWEVQRR